MQNFDTACVHPVDDKQPGGAVTTPVYTAVAYDYIDQPLQYPGFYSTYNQQRLGQIICNLEQGNWGMVFSSGMAAISTAILSFIQCNEHIIFSKDLYGGTLKFANEELPKRGIHCSFAANNAQSFTDLLRPDTKVIYIETPSNPLLNIVDLAEVAAIAKANNIITIIDNTFASPVNQQPLLHGIDIAVHSGTKYLGGHNDLPYGALVSNSAAHKEIIHNTAKMYGGSLTPQECYLAERSIKTLALRINRQNSNALYIAEWLSKHLSVAQVYYPGLTSHPQHSIAARQMSGFGGMVSFEPKTDLDGIKRLQQNLRIIRPALSLGGVESLICSPVFTSHRYLSKDERLAIGIQDSLLRLSVGIENVQDLAEDLSQAMQHIA